MEFIGLEFDEIKNKSVQGKEKIISKDSSKVVAMVIPTDEELVIAKDTAEIIKNEELRIKNEG